MLSLDQSRVIEHKVTLEALRKVIGIHRSQGKILLLHPTMPSLSDIPPGFQTKVCQWLYVIIKNDFPESVTGEFAKLEMPRR